MLPTGLKHDILNLFAGRWDRTRFGSPRMRPGDRLLVASRIREEAGLEDDAPPAHVAFRLGLLPVPAPVPGCGGEVCGHGLILYRPSIDPSDEAVRIAHGVAHYWLSIERWDHSEADVWWVTGDVLCPPRLRLTGRMAAHVPPWLGMAFAQIARV